MMTTDEYKAAVANVIAFKHGHPNKKPTTAARIHYVNVTTVQLNLRSEKIVTAQALLEAIAIALI